MGKREELIEAIAKYAGNCWLEYDDEPEKLDPSAFLDEILSILMEPDEAMEDAGEDEINTCIRVDPCGRPALQCWRAMLSTLGGENPHGR